MQREGKDNQNKTQKYSTLLHCLQYSSKRNKRNPLPPPLSNPHAKEKILTGSILQELLERKRNTIFKRKNRKTNKELVDFRLSKRIREWVGCLVGMSRLRLWNVPRE